MKRILSRLGVFALIAIVATACFDDTPPAIPYYAQHTEGWTLGEVAVASHKSGLQYLVWTECDGSSTDCNLIVREMMLGGVQREFVFDGGGFGVGAAGVEPSMQSPQVVVTDGGEVLVAWDMFDSRADSHGLCYDIILPERASSPLLCKSPFPRESDLAALSGPSLAVRGDYAVIAWVSADTTHGPKGQQLRVRRLLPDAMPAQSVTVDWAARITYPSLALTEGGEVWAGFRLADEMWEEIVLGSPGVPVIVQSLPHHDRGGYGPAVVVGGSGANEFAAAAFYERGDGTAFDALQLAWRLTATPHTFGLVDLDYPAVIDGGSRFYGPLSAATTADSFGWVAYSVSSQPGQTTRDIGYTEFSCDGSGCRAESFETVTATVYRDESAPLIVLSNAISGDHQGTSFAIAWREMPVGQERYGDVYVYQPAYIGEPSETRKIFASPNGTTNPHYALAGSEWRAPDERTWLFGAWADVANGVEAPWFCYNLRFQSAVPLVSR